mgnify:CR=1 FL=1
MWTDNSDRTQMSALLREMRDRLPDDVDRSVFDRLVDEAHEFVGSHNILTTEQYDAVMMLLSHASGAHAVVSGVAGSGKTSVVARLVSMFHLAAHRKVLVAAFTNTATRRAMDALGGTATAFMTLHSAFMKAYDRPRVMWVRDQRTGKMVEKRSNEVAFVRADNPPCASFNVVIVDEASMVSRELADIVRKVVHPGAVIIAVGDQNQLPPVVTEGEYGFGFDLPNALVRLRVNNRAKFETDVMVSNILDGRRLPKPGKLPPHDVPGAFVSRRNIAFIDAALNDPLDDVQILVGTHKTRGVLLRRLRRDLPPVEIGNRLRCRTTSKEASLSAGDELVVVSVGRVVGLEVLHLGEIVSEKCVEIVGRMGRTEVSVFVPLRALTGDCIDNSSDFQGLTGWARDCDKYSRLPVVYAHHAFIDTVHAAQGNQWDHVVVMADDCPNPNEPTFARQWLYTAASRARQRLDIFK